MFALFCSFIFILFRGFLRGWRIEEIFECLVRCSINVTIIIRHILLGNICNFFNILFHKILPRRRFVNIFDLIYNHIVFNFLYESLITPPGHFGDNRLTLWLLPGRRARQHQLILFFKVILNFFWNFYGLLLGNTVNKQLSIILFNLSTVFNNCSQILHNRLFLCPLSPPIILPLPFISVKLNLILFL